ncbi:hypothetical protein BCR41DRAFT_344172 [Lobosporangium transversale]|uniref:F-box domain-containing protein n=1 Tax=Lobosporangium transversale TaxID=64571 RepID=A0A1Y2H492_9FUNG|nr:hypothetical protein BCR41DRAFT_344172 [Lobosporangium transversale]ORZ28844.1 hypothetical protein BCR41DRAFT_344172 [Lobosporangium transversale]|eukprot:XP_021886517.1 hypothetical protein BCR41DRAFT_344172 [Lobosporangium transversale]
MSNLKLNPLEILEIISLIGSFLDRKDLLNCLCVSKTFHGALIWHIWRKIIVRRHGPFTPTGEALQKHKEYIEKIHFIYPQKDIPEEYGSLQGCIRLQFIQTSRISPREPAPTRFLNLIKAHNSTITKINLAYVQNSQLLWETLLGCANFNRLKVASMCINDGVDIFFQVCKKLGYLDFKNVSIRQLPTDFLSGEASEYTFPNMHTLRVDDVRIDDPPHPHTSPYCLGTLVRRCPNLSTLEYRECYPRIDVRDKFYNEAFFHHSWTLDNLSELSFPSIGIKDEDLAALLRRMTELRRLDIPCCDFGQLSLQALLADEQEILYNGQVVRKIRLRRLCETVEILMLDVRNKIDGLVYTILSNCPRLKRLCGPRIMVTEIVDGAEWVSTQLTDLIITLVADIDQETEEGMAKTRIVFKQLGKLTRLHSLCLTAWVRSIRTLDLQLRAGLDELANLRSLYTLSFRDDFHQQMQLKDATWMVNNWPSIRYLYGRVNWESDENGEDINTLVQSFLKSHNIYCFP